MTVLTVDGHEPDQSGEFALWIAAAIIVLALHVGLALAYLWLRPEPEAVGTAPAFDVAFMPQESQAVAPSGDSQPEPVPPNMDQPQEPPKDLTPPVPEEPPPLVPEQPPPQQQPPPPTPQVEAMVPPEEPPPPAPAIPVPSELPPPPPEQATTAPDEKPPEVVVPPKPVVVPPPSPKVMHEEKKIEKEEKIEKREKAEKRDNAEKRQQKVEARRGDSNRTQIATAPNPGAESEGARMGRESWLSQFVAQIRRAATYPSGSSGSGTAQVSVTVARSGRLVSRRLVASAGSPALDNAALAAIERAQPFPPFPASMPEAQISRLVPLHLRPQ